MYVKLAKVVKSIIGLLSSSFLLLLLILLLLLLLILLLLILLLLLLLILLLLLLLLLILLLILLLLLLLLWLHYGVAGADIPSPFFPIKGVFLLPCYRSQVIADTVLPFSLWSSSSFMLSNVDRNSEYAHANRG